MRYVSTRGQAPAVSFTDAILAGLAPDGGLYVPDVWPAFSADELQDAAVYPYAAIAEIVLRKFIGAPAFEKSDAATIAKTAYGEGGAFAHRAVTPLVQIDRQSWVLELFHGPSLAFKDIAMQLIAPLYDAALKARGSRLTVVCATSGDTGGAAVEALKKSEQVDLFVLLPKGRVSEVQRRFMSASGAANVYAIEIESDFDACQATVKSLFADRDFSARASLSGVNSINWARILAQSVYYVGASSTLAAGGVVDFVVPSGNFGDAFAGFVAKKMGAPIGFIRIATNANDILARTLNTGRYERAAQSQATISPAMDIQVASNFERLVFEALDRDGEHTAALFTSLGQSGGFDVPKQALDFMRAHFTAGSVDDAKTRSAIADMHKINNMLICPHTAVGVASAPYSILHPQSGDLGDPCVYLATAHPAKFPETVAEVTGAHPALPARNADLFSRPEKIDALPNDAEAVKAFIRERSRAWA